jgi:hypothetical protein
MINKSQNRRLLQLQYIFITASDLIFRGPKKKYSIYFDMGGLGRA